MTGEEWLTTVFAPALREGSIREQQRHHELRQQLLALFDCEVLDGPTLADALGRLDDARDRAQRAAERARPRVRAPRTFAEPPTNRLLRVLAPALPLADVDVTTFYLTSVELWEQQVHLFIAAVPNATNTREEHEYDVAIQQWVRLRRAGFNDPVQPPEAPGLRRLLGLIIGLDDDAGTRYQIGQSGGSSTEWRVHHAFTPGAPGAATRLIVNVRDDDGRPLPGVEVPLRDG